LRASLRLEFEQPLDSRETFQRALLAWIARARQRAGADVAPTSLERELAARSRLQTFVTRVHDVQPIAPHIRRITFRGGLDGFVPLGPDQFLYVMVPRPGAETEIHERFRFADLDAITEARRPRGAYYTVSAWRPATGELDIWFVLHQHAGPVSSWAADASPGDRVALWGPRASFAPPRGARDFLLIGDDTAMPAITAMLDALPRTCRVRAVVETVDAAHIVPLNAHPLGIVDWVFRDGAPAGTGTALLDAVRRLRLHSSAELFVFGAGESRQMRALRRYCRDQLGLPPEQMRITGYWRRSGGSSR
jgi:NADPH-dependent ferric siderophore reductase